MNIAVRYYTKGGNTKRLAEAVADAVGVEASGGEDGEVPCSRSNIENRLRGKGLQRIDGFAAPATVDAE